MGVSQCTFQTEHGKAMAMLIAKSRPALMKNPVCIQSETRLRLLRDILETKSISNTPTVQHVMLKSKLRMLHWCFVLPQPGCQFRISSGWLTLSPFNYTIGGLLQVCGDTRAQRNCKLGPTHGILTLAPQSIVGL